MMLCVFFRKLLFLKVSWHMQWLGPVPRKWLYSPILQENSVHFLWTTSMHLCIHDLYFCLIEVGKRWLFCCDLKQSGVTPLVLFILKIIRTDSYFTFLFLNKHQQTNRETFYVNQHSHSKTANMERKIGGC